LRVIIKAMMLPGSQKMSVNSKTKSIAPQPLARTPLAKGGRKMQNKASMQPITYLLILPPHSTS
jgi:hypothetical protein